MSPSSKVTSSFLNLSFSGAGHLLPYHLGVSSAILQHLSHQEGVKRIPTSTSSNRRRHDSVNSKINTSSKILPIKAVAGSSSGAIAAVLFSKLPHRVEEFAHRFIKEEGKAFEILSSMLHDEERHWTSERHHNDCISTDVSIDQNITNAPPSLYIATTKCTDGSSRLFRFSTNQIFTTISSSWNNDDILDAVKASCRIPASFHPVDIFPSFMNQHISYPDEEGICIGGSSYVDGGIATPAPSVPTYNKKNFKSIVISPISYAGDSKIQESTFRISPIDDSFRLLPFHNIACRNDFLVKPSIQNVRALRVGSGATNSVELQEWFERGLNDANRNMHLLKEGKE